MQPDDRWFYYYDPAARRQPPPTVSLTAGPVARLCINEEWRSWVVGWIARGAFEDIWPERAEFAVDIVNEMFAQLGPTYSQCLPPITGVTTVPVGTIIYNVSSATPDGCLPMDGSTHNVADWPELFAVLPTAWISGTQFTLPDMQSEGAYTNAGAPGSFVGQNLLNLSSDQIPDHEHGMLTGTRFTTFTSSGFGQGAQATSSGSRWINTAPQYTSTEGVEGPTGQPIDNRPRTLSSYAYIVAESQEVVQGETGPPGPQGPEGPEGPAVPLPPGTDPAVGQPLVTLDDTMDCLWGATFDTYELILDRWRVVKGIIDASVDLLSAISGLSDLKPNISPDVMAFIESAVNFGTAAIDAYMEDQTTQDNWSCTIFTSIVSDGRPYTLTNDNLAEGWAFFNGPFPAGLGDALRFFTNNETTITYWQRRTNDLCSDDWRVTCNPTCGPPLAPIVSWDDPRIVSVTPAPNQAQSATRYGWAAGTWSPVVIKLDRPYCVGQIQYLHRTSFVTPSAAPIWVYGVGQPPQTTRAVSPDASGSNVNLGGYITDTITFQAPNPGEANSDLKIFFDTVASPGIQLSELQFT